jgi:nitrite reductase (NADH) small subunit
MSWVRITIPENVPQREGRAVVVGEQEIALFNLGDRFLAVDNRCPHKGGPLADGIVSGSTVVCPLHNWQICLESGEVERPRNEACRIETYPTRLEDGLIWIELSDDREMAA